jgi:hypothetical protein
MSMDLVNSTAVFKEQPVDEISTPALPESDLALPETEWLPPRRFGIVDLWEIRGRNRHTRIFRNKIE